MSARGTVGTVQLREVGRMGTAAGKAAADRRAADLAGLIAEFRAAGVTTTSGLARALTVRGVATARGGAWTPTQVARVLRRVDRNDKWTIPALPDLSPLQQAIDAHRDKFGNPPGVWGLYGHGRDDELTRLIQAAISAGKPFDSEAVQRAWGRTIPPGAIG